MSSATSPSPSHLLPAAEGAVAAAWAFAVILATNLVPVVGVLFFGWGVFILLLLYWLENVIIGLFVALRLDSRGEVVAKGGQPIGKVFFLAHYGVFMAVHGMFVVALFLEPKSFEGFVTAMGGWWWMIVAVAALFFEHAYADRAAQRAGKGSQASPGARIGAAYIRLVILHVTIIGGGMAAETLGSPHWALLMLIALKTLFDLVAWVIQLPQTGPLGRVKQAFQSGLTAGLFGLILSLVVVIPTAVLGSVIGAFGSVVTGRRMQPEAWLLGYGFAAAGAATFIAFTSAWLHELLGGLEHYRRSPGSAKAVIVLVLMSFVVVAVAWGAAKGYQILQTPA